MKKQNKFMELRNKMMGLGETSVKKTYYPEFQKKIKELEEAEKKYRSIFDNAVEGIFQTSIEGETISINRSFYEIFGYSSAEELLEAISYNVENLYKSKLERKEILDKLKKDKKYMKKEIESKTKNGEAIWVSMNMRMVEEESKTWIEGSLINISKEKEARSELIAAKEKAEKASKAKTIFLANMSHEIRTPMNGIIGNLELLNMTNLIEEQKKYIKNIDISLNNLLAIINDILDIAKIEEGKVQLEEKATSLKEFCADLYSEFYHAATRKGIELNCELDREIPDYLKFDRVKLRQILSNLLSNAIKFTDEGEVNLYIRKSEEKKDYKVGLKIIIEDTGIGISAEQEAEIFEPFVQGDMTYTKKYQGTGLGLSISKKLVELMKGDIEYVRRNPKGSIFRINLEFEILDLEVKKMERIEEPSAEMTENKDKKTVLVVEDNEIIQETLCILLEHKGYLVQIAKNGEEAIDKYEKNSEIDLILMDIQMPSMNGVEATRVIRNKEKKNGTYVYIIALTAYAMKEDKSKFINEGMDDYLSKPVRSKELYEIIEKYI